MHFMNGLIATFVALAPIASAQCEPSLTCKIGSFACNRLCEMRGHTAGGVCQARDGCPGEEICACKSGKRDDDVVNGDAYLDDMLDGVMSKEDFVEGMGQGLAEQDAADVDKRDLAKRSFCCSWPPPFAGLCCENSCIQAGHKEGGQCSANNVCTCG